MPQTPSNPGNSYPKTKQPFARSLLATALFSAWLGIGQNSLAVEAPVLAAVAPAGSSAPLPSQLQDKDPSVRASFLLSAKDRLTPDMVRIALRDPHPRVRASLLEALGARRWQSWDSTPAKEPLVLADGGVRQELRAALEAFPEDTAFRKSALFLFQFYPAEGLPIATKLLEDRNLDVQLAATAFLGRFQFSGTVTGAHWKKLPDWDTWPVEEKQAFLVHAAGYGAFESPTAVRALKNLLKDKYAGQDLLTRRLMAAVAAGNYSLENSLRVAADDTDPAILFLVANNLGKLGPDSAAIAGKLAAHPDVRLRRALAAANAYSADNSWRAKLKEDGDQEVRDWLVAKKSPSDDPATITQARIQLLERILSRSDMDHLLPHLSDEERNAGSYQEIIGRYLESGNGFHRRWALQSLPTKGQAVEARLAKALDDPSPIVRNTAITRLASFGGETNRLLIEARAASSDEQERAQAILGLRNLGLKKSLPLMISALTDPSPLVRRNGVDGITSLKALETGPQIVRLLGDGDQRVRETAIHAVGELGLADGITGLLQALDRPESRTKAAALAALTKLRYRGAEARVIAILNGTIDESSPDYRQEVQHEAVNYLTALGTDKALPVMKILFEASDSQQARAVGSFLARNKSREIQAFLVKTAKSSDPEVACRALDPLVEMKVVAAWRTIADLSAKCDESAAEALLALGRLREAAPILLRPDQPQERRAKSIQNLIVAAPRETEAAVAGLLRSAGEESFKAGLEAYLGLVISLPRYERFFQEVAGNGRGDETLQKLKRLSPVSDRTAVATRLKKIVREESAKRPGQAGDMQQIAGILAGDPALANALAQKETEKFSKEDAETALYFVLLNGEKRLERKLPALVASHDLNEGARLMGGRWLRGEAVSSELSVLPPRFLAQALAGSKRYTRAWLQVYANALQKTPDGADRLEHMKLAALDRDWKSTGIDARHLKADLGTLALKPDTTLPEVSWLVIELLKQTGANAEGLQWTDNALAKVDESSPPLLRALLQWQKAELLMNGGKAQEALQQLNALEETVLPNISRRDQEESPIPIDSYTLILKARALLASGQGKEATKALQEAEQKLVLSQDARRGADHWTGLIRALQQKAGKAVLARPS